MKSAEKNPDKSIQRFWKWFEEHSAVLSASTVPDAVINQLEERLFEIHRIDWEIGPGRRAPNLFALSPSGEEVLLVLTRRIIALAPQLENWEFCSAKPPRDWNLVFTLETPLGPVEIDAKLWEFIAYRFKDGTYDLVLKPDDKIGLSDEYMRSAATIIVDGEIGEEARIEKFPTIEVVNSWDEKTAASAKKLGKGFLSQLL